MGPLGVFRLLLGALCLHAQRICISIDELPQASPSNGEPLLATQQSESDLFCARPETLPSFVLAQLRQERICFTLLHGSAYRLCSDFRTKLHELGSELSRFRANLASQRLQCSPCAEQTPCQRPAGLELDASRNCKDLRLQGWHGKVSYSLV